MISTNGLFCGIYPPHTRRMGMATIERAVVVDGKLTHDKYEVLVRIMAITEGYALVRRLGGSPFVIESRLVRVIECV